MDKVKRIIEILEWWIIRINKAIQPFTDYEKSDNNNNKSHTTSRNGDNNSYQDFTEVIEEEGEGERSNEASGNTSTNA